MYSTAIPMQRMDTRRGEIRCSILCLELLGVVVLVQCDWADQKHQKCDGHCGSDGPIAISEELVPEHPANHQIIRSAEQGRNDEFADGRDEDEHGARNYTGH